MRNPYYRLPPPPPHRSANGDHLLVAAILLAWGWIVLELVHRISE